MSSALANVHQVRCSFCRLPSNHWSIATALLSRTYKSVSSGSVHVSISDKKKLKKRRHALIFAHKERFVDRVAREDFTESLHDTLKNGHMLGLIDRGDGYVSVRELLNYPNFRMLSFPNLQKVVNEDRWHRFELLYEPLKGGDADSWWIRVKEKEVKDVKISPILSPDNVGAAIYGTTLEAWRSYISLKGISRENDNHIKMFQGIPVEDFFTSESSLSNQVLIHINVKHAMSMGIRFSLASKPSPSIFSSRPSLHIAATISDSLSPSGFQIRPPPPSTQTSISNHKNKMTWIITPGNEFGFLPPECFSKVEVLNVRRKVLFTLEKGVVELEPRGEEEEGEAILNSDMESTEDAMKYMALDRSSERGMNEYVDINEKDLDQFYVDPPTDSESEQSQLVHADLKKEALAIFSA